MSKVLFAVSGSIAAFKAAQVVSQLVQRGHEVQIVTTPSALKFVGSATWEGLTDRTVVSDIFAEGHQMDHIQLARWADVLLLCPATAHAISQWASGSGADLPSALFLAFERTKPVFIAPAMNKEMWAHPAVQLNLRRLVEWNVQVIEPEEGSLACGETGAGRLAAAEVIISAIESPASASSPAPQRKERVLVTSGATREPIDGVRFITNVSSGRTGASLADQLTKAGYDVIYLHGSDAEQPSAKTVEQHEFSDFASLQSSLKEILGGTRVKAVIHAAAVSDFSVAGIQASDGLTRVGNKLSSGQDLSIHLKQNPKLLLNLKEWGKEPAPYVVGFKLTDVKDAREQARAVERLLSRHEVDAVVWNDLKSISKASHSGRIYSKSKGNLDFSNKCELGAGLISLLQGGDPWS